jgi:hypothetical protein
MEITIVNPNARLVAKVSINSDDQIQILLSHINREKKQIPTRQYIILRDQVLEPERTFADYNIRDSTTLFYTVDENLITQGFLNSSVFFRDFYSGGNREYQFASRQKYATVPPTNCSYCPNQVYMTTVFGTPHYGQLCREHIPHIPIDFHHMGVGFIDSTTKQNYRFDPDTNKWVPYVCMICNKPVYDTRDCRKASVGERDICQTHKNHPISGIFKKSRYYQRV